MWSDVVVRRRDFELVCIAALIWLMHSKYAMEDFTPFDVDDVNRIEIMV